MHVCGHPLSKPGDDLVVVRSPATMRPALWGGAWEGYPIDEFQHKFRTGYPPVRASRASVLHIRMPHGLGGTPPLYGGPRGCSWTVGAVLGGRASHDCVPGWTLSAVALPAPSEWCSAGGSASHAAPRYALAPSWPADPRCHAQLTHPTYTKLRDTAV